MTDAPTSAPPARRRRSGETWTRVREDYLAGVPAPELCARYDVGLSALRSRARGEGWRRTDTPDPAPLPELDAAIDRDAPAPDPADVADLAWRRAAAAVELGRLAEGERWTRLAARLRALAEHEAAGDARALAAVARTAAAGERLRSLAEPRHRPLLAAIQALSDAAGADAPHESHAAPVALDGREPGPRGAGPGPGAGPPDVVYGDPAPPAAVPVPASVPLPAPDPSPSEGDLRDPPAPPAPRRVQGPAPPSRPPEWARHALGMR